MLEPVLLLAGPAPDAPRVAALAQHGQHPLYVVQRRERRHPLGPRLELARRLRAAEQEHGENRQLLAIEIERLLGQVPVLDGAAAVAAGQPGQPVQAQPLRCLPDRRLVIGGDRVAVGRLIARQPQTIERQRILIRGRPALLDQAPEHPLFGRGELGDVHGSEHNRRYDRSVGRC